MGRRANQSPEARERERATNRERMARLRQDPEHRARINAKRSARDAERRLVDAELVARLRANKKRYYDKRKDDDGFWIPRKEYMRRWKEERRAEEEFQSFMDRLDAEENDIGATTA